jgi:hypothetical protein
MTRFGCALAAWLCLTSLTVAADAPAAAEKPADDAQAAKIAKWVSDLRNEQYATRKQAADALVDAGAAAAEPVARAAYSDDREPPRRYVGILREMLHSGDEPTETAAKAALEKLAQSDRKFLAEQAAEALKAPAPAGRRGGARIQIGGIVVAGGQNVRISSKNTNGQREVTVEIGPKKIHFTDDNGRDIVMQVTEPVKDADGNTAPQTKEYVADDLDDLKQKHPDAARLYEQFGGNGGVIRVVGGFGNANQADALKRHVEFLERHLQRLEDHADEGRFPEEHLERVRENLDAQVDRLRKQVEELERQAEQEAEKEKSE